MNETDFRLQLERFSWLIEQSLQRELPQPGEAGGDPVIDAMRYSALARGKRLRPVLLMAAATTIDPALADDPFNAVLMPAAVAVECIHVYSLIHDDLPSMDNDDLRRGQPTCHRKFGEATALLAGDALLTLAFELLGRRLEGLAPERQLNIVSRMAAAAGWQGMIHGQSLDLSAEEKHIDLDDLRAIHQGKTGALFRAAVVSGAWLAGAQAAQVEAFERFAGHFGLAFQIVDDILDVTGSTEKTGKQKGSDAKNNKTTYIKLAGLAGARRHAAEETEKALDCLKEVGSNTGFLSELTRRMLNRTA